MFTVGRSAFNVNARRTTKKAQALLNASRSTSTVGIIFRHCHLAMVQAEGCEKPAKQKIQADARITLFLVISSLSVNSFFNELELELIQTQMTQKTVLRAEVYARALRASQNRKENSVQRAMNHYATAYRLFKPIPTMK